jgi:hypothetical protein
MNKDILILIGIGAGIYFLNKKTQNVGSLNDEELTYFDYVKKYGIFKGDIIKFIDKNGDNSLIDEKAIILDFGSKNLGSGYLVKFLNSGRKAIIFRNQFQKISGIEKHPDQKSHNVNIKISGNKFINDQIFYVISLKSIKQKKNVIKNSLLPNIDDYNIDEITKRILKDNLKYSLQQKTIPNINRVLLACINAINE